MSTNRFDWEFFLLGGLRIAHHGTNRDVPPARTHTLLAALLIHWKISSRLGLVGLLYPDAPEREGLKLLSDRLWLLRKSLPDLPLIASKDKLSIPKAARWIDLEAFQENSERDNEQNLQTAINLYQGELLPTLYDDWILLERENLYVRYIRCLKRVTRVLMAHNDYTHATLLMEKLNRLDPFDEQIVRNLMRAYKSQGQRGAALSLFDRLSIILQKEFSTVPEPATIALSESIRSHSILMETYSKSSDRIENPDLLIEEVDQAIRSGNRGAAEQLLESLKKSAEKSLIQKIHVAEIMLLMQFGDWQKAADQLQSANTNDSPIGLVLAARIAIHRGDFHSGKSLASAALLAAHQVNNYESELEALLALSEAQQGLGEIQDAVINASKALAQTNKDDKKFYRMRAYHQKGECMGSLGLRGDALELLYEAESIAHQYDFLLDRIRILGSIGLQKRHLGRYSGAAGIYEKGLSLSRDLALDDLEANFLQGLATVYDYLGMTQESIRVLQQAEEIYRKTGNQFGIAENCYHMAYALVYHDGNLITMAIDYAKQAIGHFSKIGHVRYLASSHAALGYNLWLHGNARQALASFDQAISGFEQANANDYLPEVFAYKGLAYLDLDDLELAMQNTHFAIQRLAGQELYDIASELYYARAMVLKATGDLSGMKENIERAYQNLLSIAAKIEEEPARQAFFRRDPTVRRLMKEVFELGLAQPFEQGVIQKQVTGPHGKMVKFDWIVDAGSSDIALKNAKGSITLRRTRLERILKESAQYGVNPSNLELAQTLGVSIRTIQRDRSTISS